MTYFTGLMYPPIVGILGWIESLEEKEACGIDVVSRYRMDIFSYYDYAGSMYSLATCMYTLFKYQLA